MKIAFRILVLPFMMAISLIALLFKWILFNLNFIKNGGELIAYDDKLNKKTLVDVYDKLVKILEKE